MYAVTLVVYNTAALKRIKLFKYEKKASEALTCLVSDSFTSI